jgi:hypothetical protein
MADGDSAGLPSLRAVTALLREARSLPRRADKLDRSVAAVVDDPRLSKSRLGPVSSWCVTSRRLNARCGNVEGSGS